MTPASTTIPDRAKNWSTTMLLRSAVHCCSSSSSLLEAPSLPLSPFASSSFSSPSSSTPENYIWELSPSITSVPSLSESQKNRPVFVETNFWRTYAPRHLELIKQIATMKKVSLLYRLQVDNKLGGFTRSRTTFLSRFLPRNWSSLTPCWCTGSWSRSIFYGQYSLMS